MNNKSTSLNRRNINYRNNYSATYRTRKSNKNTKQNLPRFVNLFENRNNKKLFFILLIVSMLVICLAILYAPAKTYYLSVRENEKLQAQYQSITKTNENLQKEINYLQTEEGIKDRANKKLGLIEEGQSLGSVSGLTNDQNVTDTVNETSSRLKYKQIQAPTKWYTGFCNFIFGVSEDN